MTITEFLLYIPLVIRRSSFVDKLKIFISDPVSAHSMGTLVLVPPFTLYLDVKDTSKVSPFSFTVIFLS